MGLRPMLYYYYYYYYSGDAAPGCGDSDCVGAVMLIGTPVLWFPALLVLGWAIWRVISRYDWRYAAVLVAYGAGLPAVVREPQPADVLLLHDATGAVPGDRRDAGAR